MSAKCARRATEREAPPVYSASGAVYSDGGSGEPTETKRLVGATPQALKRAISDGSTSSIARTRKGVSRGVAADNVQRMGRKVHLPHTWRFCPSFFVASARRDSRCSRLVAWPIA